jgi:hypothetical protein
VTLFTIIYFFLTFYHNIRLYQRENDAIFRGLTPVQATRKMDEFSGDFELFKKGREEPITAVTEPIY